MSSVARLLAAQVAADVRTLPATARHRLSVAGRVERCQSIAELRALAQRTIPAAVFDYADGAAWDEVTAARNQTDFGRLTIRPRMLVDVSSVDTSTTLAGQRVSLPLVGAPTGMTGLFHHRGEAGIATALHAAGCISTLSTAATYSIEEIAAVAPGSMWFQIYMWRDRGLVQELLDRARTAGYRALVVTVDAPRAGPRERDVRNRFAVPPRLTLASLLQGVRRPRWSSSLLLRPRISMVNAASRIPDAGTVTMAHFVNEQFDPSCTWDELVWLRDVWGGPLYVKGILRDDDARTAVDLGATGVIVSNHGGRQLDTAPSSIRALPEVVQAVGSEAEVLLDGGVRRGTDVVKALALGARACMIGRPLVYGLAAGGDAGAARTLAILAAELRLALALAGCPTLEAVDESLAGRAAEDETSLRR